MGTSEQLAALLAELSNRREVFAVSGERTEAGLAEHVHALAAAGERAWETHIDPRTSAISVAQVEAALQPVTRETAELRLAALASRSFVHSYDLLEERRARQVAEQVVALLGDAAEWWSNHDPGEVDFEFAARTGVTRCTFDGVVAGRDATRFAVLLQVGED
jgi:hypothetical protein